MPKSTVTLADKYDLAVGPQILSGTQAIVRLMLMMRARDTRAGHNTAGYVSGYRGSPIAGLEAAFHRVKPLLKDNHVVFQPGLNEDLAATAVWGAQQAELFGEGRYDGVYSVWYGKGPGVDRTGDVFRHANHAGTSKFGGVIALMGDDHMAESSTTAHQSEFAFVDAGMPVLNPSGVQELLDYGLHGFALSRFAGVWVGLKCVKDNIESTATVDGRLDRVTTIVPQDFALPEGGLNVRRGDDMLQKEQRLLEHKIPAIHAYVRANGLDRVVFKGGVNPRIGIVSCGKSYLDVRTAFEALGIDQATADQLGISLYKAALTWPLEPKGLAAFAKGLDYLIVVEEKRALLEPQIKELLFNVIDRPVVIGKTDADGRPLFRSHGSLDPREISLSVGEQIVAICGGNPTIEGVKTRLGQLTSSKSNAPQAKEALTRIPYFCAGCPHSSSTVVPKGSRAYAGIGCHYMAQWMDRETEGFTQMGGEGANWIGEAPFSKRGHVFQNLGDGTYIHSGSLAVRASIAAGVTVTYKILFNDAVAMTGGQKLDGAMTVPMIVNQMRAEGVREIVVVTDEPDKYPIDSGLPADVKVHHRRDLQTVQQAIANVKGVSVLVYDQTCAAEKRRRRKIGTFPDPNKRVFINPAVCEGCGDCGKKSNCVAIQPLETELGTKRKIDQSSCNKDFSCVNGFCPSFVTVHGAEVRKASMPKTAASASAFDTSALPTPQFPSVAQPYTIVVTGIGGTGVVTVSAVLGQAAHIAGLGFGAIDMTGLAQKNGAVACHVRIAADGDQISAIRVGSQGADLVLGCDLVVTASAKVLDAMRPDHTAVTYSPHEVTTASFAQNPTLSFPTRQLAKAISDRVRKGRIETIDAQQYASLLFGDTIAANMMMLGVAYQLGQIPVPADAIEEAIVLNGAAVEMNRNAFRAGRLAIGDRAKLDQLLPKRPVVKATTPPTLVEIIAHRAQHLADYQDANYAARYRALIDKVAAAERDKATGRSGFAETAAKGLAKLMAYKDEYEVGRLYSSPAFKAALGEQFQAYDSLEFHLAPPLLARRDKATGEPRKIKFGRWMLPVFGMLAKGKSLRGTRWDVFGYTAERKLERRMLSDYEALLTTLTETLRPETHAVAVQLAALPLEVKGFGPVKHRNYNAMKLSEQKLMAAYRTPQPSPTLQAAE